MGTEAIRLMKFCLTYAGWHTISKTDQKARRAARRLCELGLCERNDTGQLRPKLGGGWKAELSN